MPADFDSICLAIVSIFTTAVLAQEYPWSYDADVFGGPQYWGELDPRWQMCRQGKMQSPIDIVPDRLLFDPNLKPIDIDRISVTSELVNTGQMPRVRIGNSIRRPSANLTGGPFNGYRYRIQRIDIHVGFETINGSEHTIDGRRYPMELQLLAYNVDLYANFSQASRSPRGIAAVAVLVDFAESTTDELENLAIAAASVPYKNRRIELPDLKPWKLLPKTTNYITYEGSMTAPGCDETVTWIIGNTPIYISQPMFKEFQKLKRTPEKEQEVGYVAPNFRDTQPFNGRVVRTNIRHQVKMSKECKIPLAKISYKSKATVETKKHKRRHASEEDSSYDEYY